MSAPKKSAKPKLTDAERHARFKDMAREVGASEKPEDFDRAFTEVVPERRAPPGGPATNPKSER